MKIWLVCPPWTITTDSIDYSIWGAHVRFNVLMNHSKLLTLATSAGDPALAAMIDCTRLEAEQDDRYRPTDGRATNGRDILLQEEDVRKLRKRCRANDLALASMAGALSTLRRANRALNDENMLLRQQVAEVRERASPKRWPNVRGGGRPVGR